MSAAYLNRHGGTRSLPLDQLYSNCGEKVIRDRIVVHHSNHDLDRVPTTQPSPNWPCPSQATTRLSTTSNSGRTTLAWQLLVSHSPHNVSGATNHSGSLDNYPAMHSHYLLAVPKPDVEAICLAGLWRRFNENLINFLSSAHHSGYSLNTIKLYKTAALKFHHSSAQFLKDVDIMALLKKFANDAPPIPLGRVAINLSSTFCHLIALYPQAVHNLRVANEVAAFLLGITALLQPLDLQRITLRQCALIEDSQLTLVISRAKE
ncbi:hypothetical protein BJV82DRAFT_584378 [Fennellomyces sp. T-0311]|nr:hypothetical protein BJV82DRAFT_584378 [Fennellomyces sp. T-0311]